jgi:hypothetical protein
LKKGARLLIMECMLGASVLEKDLQCNYEGNWLRALRSLGLILLFSILSGLAISVHGAESQETAKAGKLAGVSAPEKAAWSRIVMIGASASAGFIESEPFGGPTTSNLRLNRYLDAALQTSHEPVRNFSSAMFFMQPEGQGQSQSERALQTNPSLLVALDYLFWFCYGDGSTDKERLQRFEQGLKFLEPFRCPLIIGDLPDASAAVERMLTPDQIPSHAALSAANRRLKEWASARKQTVVIPLSAFMRNAMANKPLTVHGHTLGEGKTRVLLQDDKLHPSAAGCAVLALAIFDSLLSNQTALSSSDIRWDAREVYHLTLDPPRPANTRPANTSANSVSP